MNNRHSIGLCHQSLSLRRGSSTVCDGIGTDIVPVARVEALVQQRGTTFLERWFTQGEISYCYTKAHPARHLAARLAAKESVLKALGWSWDGPVPWRSVEVLHDERGAPTVRLHGPIADAAAEARVSVIRISLSHCDEFATAVATVAVAGA